MVRKWGACALLMCGIWVSGMTTDAWAVATNLNVVAGGSPVAKAKVTVTLNDGSTTEGTTDANGQLTLNVDPSTVKETVVEKDGDQRRLVGAWLPVGDSVTLDYGAMIAVAGGAGGAGLIGGSSSAVPPRQYIAGPILRFNGFGGPNWANSIKNVQGTGSFSNSTFSKLDTTNGYTAGAGIEWKWSSGWVFGANYQYLHEGIKGQDVQETFSSGGSSSTSPQKLIGGSLDSNVVAFNFGYEWDCWKVFGRTLSLGLGAGPVIGSTTFSTFNQNSTNQFVGQNTTKGATGLNTQGTLRYHIAGGFSTFLSYQ
jgi:hypothetical protein